MGKPKVWMRYCAVCAKDTAHIIEDDSKSMICGKCGQPHSSRGVYDDGKIILLSREAEGDKKKIPK